MTNANVAGSDTGGRAQEPEHRPNEVRALSALAFEELRGFPGAIRDTHLGIAARAFRGAGAASRPAQLIHDAVSRGVYDALGAGAGLIGRASDAVIEKEGIGANARLSSTRGGSALVGALNGLIGDRLELLESDLDQGTSVRLGGEPVPLERRAQVRRPERDDVSDSPGPAPVSVCGLVASAACDETAHRVSDQCDLPHRCRPRIDERSVAEVADPG